MKRKYREAIAGYLFASPILIAILVFTIIPIIQAFYYSFTDYDALKQQMFGMIFNPEWEIADYLFVFPEDIKEENFEEFLDKFDTKEFIENLLGLKLSEKQEKVLTEFFDKRKMLKDFSEGRLNKDMSLKDFMKKYMVKGSNLFSKYRPQIIGLKNFKDMFKDEYFWIALKNSFIFSAVVTPIQTFLALILAIAANQKIKGVKFFKLSFFIPSITSSAAISMIFLMLYSKPGLINRLLGVFGLQPIDWLNNVKTALPAIMAMNIWTTAGYFMITFLAGLQNIPTSIMEAAIIDGAGTWVKFWKIILPLLKPQIIFVVTMGIIGTLQVFDQIYFLIKSQENVTMAMYIYQNAFRYGKMGYASSLALIFFLIIFLITLLQRKIMERNVEVF